MRFVFASWGSKAPPDAAACDGLVPGARIDLSHWSHNKTPKHLKRDTSVEIALAFTKEAHDLEIAANNHFDADGVLAVWTLLRPELAAAHAELIVAAAEHGDFDEWPRDERGMMLEAAIGALAGGLDDRAAYEKVLPALDTLVPAIESREDLWGSAHRALLDAGKLAGEGRVSVERVGRIAVFAHERGASELPGAWLSKLAPAGTDRVLLAFADGRLGHKYRYERPRYAWADTVERKKIRQPRRGPIRRRLGPAWIIKGTKGMTGIAYTDRAVPESPAAVAAALAEVDGQGL
jgi:hypothetical protein